MKEDYSNKMIGKDKVLFICPNCHYTEWRHSPATQCPRCGKLIYENARRVVTK